MLKDFLRLSKLFFRIYWVHTILWVLLQIVVFVVYTRIEKSDEGEQRDTGDGSPRGASVKITATNKVAARANSSAKTATSSRATFDRVHRTPGSGPKPLGQLKPTQAPKPGFVPMLTPKLPPKK
jgi:hypothetical protein